MAKKKIDKVDDVDVSDVVNCQIKEASLWYASGSEDTPFEIWTSRKSHVENSCEKIFDLTDVEKKYNVVALEDLVNIAVNERVVVSIKVVDMEETHTKPGQY